MFLVSEDWLASKWCSDEYQLANKFNKKLFALLIDDVALDRLPGGLAAQWQVVRLKGEPAERFLTIHPLHAAAVARRHRGGWASKASSAASRKPASAPDTFELQPRSHCALRLARALSRARSARA